MKKDKKRTLKKNRNKHLRKNNRTNKKKKKSKKKSIQKGGGLLPAIGVGLIATSVAAAAYKGFRLVNKIKDKTYLLRLLNKDYIEYSPKVVVTETPDFINYYLQCVSTYEFFQILLSRPEYLKSKTLQHIIKDASLKEKRDKSQLDDSYGGEFSDIDKIITALHSKDSSDIQTNLSLKPGLIETSKNKYISDLKNLLLLTARIPGSNLEDDNETPEKINPYITVNSFRWMDVIIKGIYDEYFDSAVNEILNERNISQSLHKEEMERIQTIIEELSDNRNFRSAIRKKMLECSSKPRGYLDYISSSVSWDSQKGCLSCPQQDCLIYIYDFYYDFLKENISNLPIVDKLYVLMICEARICVLSKCLALEAIRTQDKKDETVRKLIHQIYKADVESPFDKIKESSMFGDMFFQKGGSMIANDGNIPPVAMPAATPAAEPTPADMPAAMPAFDPTQAAIPAATPAADPTLADMPAATPAFDPTLVAMPATTPAADPTLSAMPAATPAGDATMMPPVATPPADPTMMPPVATPPADPTMMPPADPTMMPPADPTMMPIGNINNEQNNIKPATEDELQSKLQAEDSKISVKNSKEENLEDLIKTQLELFMKTSEEGEKEKFLKVLNLSLVDVDNLDKIYSEYIQLKVINDLTLKDFIMDLFLDKDEYSENLEILFKFIQRDGLLLLDIFSTEKLREDNILFRGSDLRDDEKLALYMKSLDGSEDYKALSLLLLRMSDKPQIDGSGKCLPNPEIENLLFIMDDNSDILNKVLKHLFSLLTESNKDILLKRIATIYNSVSIEKRKTMDRVDVMYHEVSVDKSIFDIPDYSIKVNKDKPKTLKKSSKSRNPICIQKENEFMRKIRSKEPLVIDSTTLNSLERCAIREDIQGEDKPKPPELSEEPKPPEIKLSDEQKSPELSEEPKPPEIKLSDEQKSPELSEEPKPPEIKLSDEIPTSLETTQALLSDQVETTQLAAPMPITQPAPMPITQPAPMPITQPVAPMPITQPVAPIPITQPVAPIPITQPVETTQSVAPIMPITQPVETTQSVAPIMPITQPVETTQPLETTPDIDNTMNQNYPPPLNFVQKPGIDPNTGLKYPLETN